MRVSNYYIILSSIIIITHLGIIGCNKTSVEKIEELLNEERFPNETGRDIIFIYSDSAYIRAKLETPLMHKFIEEETTIEMPEGLKVTFYNRQIEPNSFLSAQYGIQYVEKKLIEVKNNVVVVNIKGDTLTTEHLIWDQRKDKLYSEKFVRVKTGEEIILAEGFESNSTFSSYKFKNIRGTIQLNTSDESEEE